MLLRFSAFAPFVRSGLGPEFSNYCQNVCKKKKKRILTLFPTVDVTLNEILDIKCLTQKMNCIKLSTTMTDTVICTVLLLSR